MNHPLPLPRIRSWLAALAIATTLVACGGGDGGSSSSSDSSGTVTAQGTVVDDQGIPLSGATIKVIAAGAGTASASTANDGTFSIPLRKGAAGVIRVEKAGFMPMVRAASSAAGNAAFAARVVLLPVASTQNFDSTQAAVLRVPGSSARVELAAGSLVRNDGQAISGSATVQLTPIDPSKDISFMPGVMVDAKSGTPIESLGALSVNFTDATGAPLNLASGQTATIRIPATPAPGATLPATFPLYHLNESTGLWVQEGTATLQTDPGTGDKYYEGTVSHFSWWNADQPITRSNVDIGATIGGASCTVPAGARVVAQGVDYNGITGAIGNNVFVRQNSQVQLILVDSGGFFMDSVSLTSAASGGTVRLPRCLVELSMVTLSGRVTVTSGVLSNYRVQVSGDLLNTETVRIQTDGTYSFSVRVNRGTVHARLVSGLDRGTPDTRVTTTVATANASFPDLNVQDTTVNLSGCVQGWSGYRHSTAQVSLFKGAALVGEPQTLASNAPNFSWTVPINTTYTVRLSTPDATLADRSTSAVVGNVPFSLGSCVSLPVPPQAVATVNGTGFDRNFSASTSVAGDAAIASYAWTFGDGTSGTGISPSHTYASTGSFTVSLILTDALGQKSTTTTFAVAITNGGGSVSTGEQIVGGAAYGCAINGTGGVECWDGDAPNTKTPVAGLSSGVTSISKGSGFYCAITSTGALKCWGNNTYGQLGNGTTTTSSTPVDVTGLSSGVMAVSAGGSHTCAITSTGALKCWGLNSYGKLGNGGSANSSVPVTVSGLTSGVVAVSANANHTCAATNGAGVFCWGQNHVGQLGNGTTTASLVPVAVSNLTETVTALSAGYQHTCALTSTGGVKCWGENNYGQLGDNTTTDRTSPVDAIGLNTGVIAISGSGYHTCALTSDGASWCWGYNTYGQVQDTNSSHKTPVKNAVQTGVAIGVTTNQYSTCILRSDRTIQCWGWLEAYDPGG